MSTARLIMRAGHLRWAAVLLQPTEVSKKDSRSVAVFDTGEPDKNVSEDPTLDSADNDDERRNRGLQQDRWVEVEYSVDLHHRLHLSISGCSSRQHSSHSKSSPRTASPRVLPVSRKPTTAASMLLQCHTANTCSSGRKVIGLCPP